MRPLSHLRVVELAGGVGLAYAAKLFADLGADVVRVESARDLVRDRPYDVHRWLNANKRAASRLEDWLEGAALLLHDLTPSAAVAAAVDHPRLAASQPQLVVGSFTAFGHRGPWAERRGGELDISHASSWGFLSPAAASDPSLPPLKGPGHHASILTATVAATAFLAAVDRAERCGQGEHVDFSAMAAGARMTETAPASACFQGQDSSRLGTRTIVPWSIYQCRDGLVQFICVEQSQWEALVHLMGDPEWASLDVFATNADRRDNVDLVELYVGEWMATQSARDVFERGQAARLCMAPVYTMAELANDEQLRSRGFFVEGPDGQTTVGPGFRFDKPWWALERPAPGVAEHDGETWLAPAPAVGAEERTERPLQGVRVCDFTWIWAGPYCTQLLAHLGADVVRLESPEHLCLFRRLPFHADDVPVTPDTDGMFQLYNSDKRSVGIDLRHADAKEVVRRLVEQSDVVVENFAVGALAALGFGVEELRAINPDVIVVSLSGFGQTGPYAGYMAYGPSGGAVAGLYAANGYESGGAAETGVAIGDPGTGLTAAWATMAALVGRRHEVARVDVAMVEAIAATVGELWMQYLATGDAPRPAGNRDPQWAPHGVYETGTDEWVTICCTDDEQWRALVAMSGETSLTDGRFAHAPGRKSHEDELDLLVGEWVRGQDRDELVAALQRSGVSASPSLSPLALWGGNAQLEAIGMLERPDHPATGTRVVPGVPWRLSNGANGLRRPAPLLGQHTDEVLTELGFSASEIDALVSRGAVHRSFAPAPTPA